MASQGCDVGACGEADWQPALELVLRDLPAAQRGPLIDSLAKLRGEPLGPFDALVAAKLRGRMMGAVWAQPQPGRTAAVWLPQLRPGAGSGAAEQLLAAAMRCVDARGVQLTQCLLEPADDAHTPMLCACGFNHLAELHYLAWQPQDQPVAANGATGVAFVPAGQVNRPALERLIAATYQDTLDCPELNGVRAMADVVSGYTLTGDHDPDLWFVIRRGSADVGVVLLTEHRASKQAELLYMGLVPAARGDGIGRVAVRHAQRLACERRADRLVLAVDTRNSPARAAYANAGFFPWATRLVYTRPRPAAANG